MRPRVRCPAPLRTVSRPFARAASMRPRLRCPAPLCAVAPPFAPGLLCARLPALRSPPRRCAPSPGLRAPRVCARISAPARPRDAFRAPPDPPRGRAYAPASPALRGSPPSAPRPAAARHLLASARCAYAPASLALRAPRSAACPLRAPASARLKRPPQKQIKRLLPPIIKPRGQIHRPENRIQPHEHASVPPCILEADLAPRIPDIARLER